MVFGEWIYGILFAALAGVTSWKDCRTGIISNKILVFFTWAGVIIGIYYYGFAARELWLTAVLNVISVSVIGLVLFYTHSFAGGDCKLLFVMSLLYPGRFLLSYGGIKITLFFALGIGILLGYFYLLLSSAILLILGKNRVSWTYIKVSLLSFISSFVCATVYISAINLLLILPVSRFITVSPWFGYVISLFVAWAAARFKILRKWYFVLAVFLIDLLAGLPMHILPFSLNPKNYILVFLLLVFRMTISTSIYEQVSIQNLKPGMILSTLSSTLMQGSRVKGMPKISSEDLRSRLSQDEVDSIGRWAQNRHIETVSIVKKIPFAVFISLGYVVYFICWSLIQS